MCRCGWRRQLCTGHSERGLFGPWQVDMPNRSSCVLLSTWVCGCLLEAHPGMLAHSVPLSTVQEQLAFRLGEVKHLKAALKGRDGLLQDAQDRLREYERDEGAERTAAETVRQAQGEDNLAKAAGRARGQ